jgi:hypothetical protein
MPLDDTCWPTTEITDETTALLIRARGLLERGWCRYYLAKSQYGRPVGPTSKRAVMWCAYGALFAAGVPRNQGAVHPAILRLEAAIPNAGIASFNNLQKTVEPVLAAFDRAIAAGGGRAVLGRHIATGH